VVLRHWGEPIFGSDGDWLLAVIGNEARNGNERVEKKSDVDARRAMAITSGGTSLLKNNLGHDVEEGGGDEGTETRKTEGGGRVDVSKRTEESRAVKHDFYLRKWNGNRKREEKNVFDRGAKRQ